MELQILGFILIFCANANAFGNSTSDKIIIVENMCNLALCAPEGPKVWAIDYEQKICRVFPNKCQLANENCNRRIRRQPELVATTEDQCQKCYPKICPKYYEPINNCTVLVECSLKGEKVWAIDYEKKICHVFPNSCHLEIENCNRRLRCEPELVATTQDQCQKCFTPLSYESVLTSEKIIIPNRCNILFNCSLEGPKVWAMDYQKKVCRVFPNSCHLAKENCNRRNTCEPDLIATSQDQCQKCYPAIRPACFEPVLTSEKIIVPNRCNILFRCSLAGPKVWAIDYQKKICRVFPNSCHLAKENCNRRNRHEPELIATTQYQCQKCFPAIRPKFYEPISASEIKIVENRCNLKWNCSSEGPKVWAIDYEQKICRVFLNSCQLAKENCIRQSKCQPELIATTQGQCQKCFPTVCPNRCNILFKCSLAGPKVWAIDYQKKICRVFPNKCHLANENCNRRNRCEPVLIATTQYQCQKCFPAIRPKFYEPISASEIKIVENRCNLKWNCSSEGPKVWAIDYEQKICRVFLNSCQLAKENCIRQSKCQPELIATTQGQCQRCFPTVCPNRCNILFKCSLAGPKVWAIDYQKKICRVFPNKCHLANENCNRRNRCEPVLIATTQDQCQKCYPAIRPACFEPVLTSEKIIVEKTCTIALCSSEGEKVWAIDYLRKICRVFPNSCHLANENCNRLTRHEPELVATTQDQCQKCFPTICPGEPIPMSGEIIVENKKCNLQFKCSFEGPIVWAIDFEQKICRVFPNSCHLASENCNRQNRCDPELKPTTQKECQKFCPTDCPKIYEPICGYLKDKQMTFSNMCDLNRHVCKSGEIYQVLRSGQCEKC